MLHLLHKLARMPLQPNLQAAIVWEHIQSTRCERAHHDYRLGVLADIDESTGTRQSRAEFTDIEIAVGVGLGQAQHGNIESAAIVEIKLVGLVDHGMGIHRRAKTHATGRNAANHARFCRQRHQVDDFFFGGDAGHAFGHANAQIHHAVGSQFECRASCNQLAFAQRHADQRFVWHAYFAGIGGGVLLGKRLHMVARLGGQHNGIDHDAGHLHHAWMQRAALGNAFHLRNDDAARIARRHGDGQRLQCQCLAFHGQVAIWVGGGGANDAH